jgi:predicted O-methyltransferase YrrM
VIPLAEAIFTTSRVQDETGAMHPLHSNIDRSEYDFIAKLIADDSSIKRTLEIGCAYGLSSLSICSSLSNREGARHLIIDPFQDTQWSGVGVANLKRAGFNFFDLVQEPSEFTLPRLAQTEPQSFDLVFIDGWHTFDHTLLDLFYANLLIRVGGYILVDDCSFAPVAKAVSYFLNYPAFQLLSQAPLTQPSFKRRMAKLGSSLLPKPIWTWVLPSKVSIGFLRAQYSSMVALKKIRSDERRWDWFKDF